MGHHGDLHRHARRVADDEQLAADGDCPRSAGRLRVAAAETRRARVARRRYGGTRSRRPRRTARAPGAPAVHVAAAGRVAGTSGERRCIRVARHSRTPSPGRTARLAAQPLLPDLLAALHVGHARLRGRSKNGVRAHGRHVRLWLDAVGEFEAFSSLSAYRFEHPDDPFPDIVEPSGSGRTGIFDGRGLGHPLLPAARTVRNDVACVAPTQLLVVSGSNMSGKSTLLRTVGINAVLAFAGAPVRAESLRLSPLRDRRDAAHPGLAAGRPIAFLRGDHPHPRDRGHRPRTGAAALSARRALSRHQLARSPGRLVGRPAQPARSRRHRPDHDARSGADRRSRERSRRAP